MIFLARFWPYILLALIITSVGIAFKVILVQRDHARAELATTQANWELAKAANDEMSKAAQQQNDAIHELQKEQEVREKAMLEASAIASQKARPIEQKASAIAALQLTSNECVDLKSIVREARK